jgi:RNase H-like domain found in reverse transcriptase
LVPAISDSPKKLVTDASKYGLGVALIQEERPGKWLPIAFWSRKLKGAEVRYTTSEKECLAVVFGLRKYRHILYGESFTVVTDHTALKWLMSLREPKDRLARWMMEVMHFEFEVEYAPGDGTLMAVPDALSRDTMDRDLMLCQNCLGGIEMETVQDITVVRADLSTEENYGELSVESLLLAQKE